MRFGILAVLALLLPGLVHADAQAGKAKAAACAACHGVDGNSTDPLIPSLAGQTLRYLYLQLNDFKAGRRTDPRMSPMAAGLGPQDALDLAEYFSTQKLQPLAFKADPARVERGRAKAAQVLCTMCHLGSFSGQNEIPRVAGQHPEYIAKQLKAFRAKTRTNDAGNMTSVARDLTDDDIENLSQYIANL